MDEEFQTTVIMDSVLFFFFLMELTHSGDSLVVLMCKEMNKQ